MNAPSPSGSLVRKRSVSIRGHATSFSLEDAFFEIIETIARQRGISVAALVAEIDDARDKRANLSSALRLYVLEWVKRGGKAV
ncbi:aryl-sulfate sulfotransferase [Brucella endophytica]|uniref:Aryl-sulfate sulfotransferase n=1 Tax=Brucella endophytica TaxID=1963359 RepID=A0A916WHG6_9HYPH|nr:ribbon-helix-helix domain-containing protein [Brucella endophytica]GGA97554.1 aryl-sulfate sulfotransferase [Brucella endophytica]